LVKADSVQGEFSRHEARTAYTMSDICMQHCASNGGKLPYTSIQ